MVGVLYFIGFRDTSLNSLRNYLSKRLKLDSLLSSPKTIINCIPQSSIFGPLFFCISRLPTLALHTYLKNKHIYADDSQVYRVGHN